MAIKVATVCTGVGAPEQAIKELGIPHKIAFGCEIDQYARKTYQANFDPHRMYTDMTAESWIGEEYESDLFVGGIPCQAFSLAGKRLGELDPRGLLFYNFYDYVKKQRPKAFLIENVKGLISDDKGRTFQNWIQLLGRSVNTQELLFKHPDSLEYNLHWTVLNAKDFGLPQNRERVFVIGIRKDLPNSFQFPAGWPLDIRLKDVLEPNVDEKYYLSDKVMDRLLSSELPETNGPEFYLNDNGKLRKTEIATCIDSNYWKGMDNHAQSPLCVDSKLIPFGNSQDQKLSPLDCISQTVSAGHFNQPKVMIEEPIPVRMVGRNPDNPKSRKSGEKTEQMIEAFEGGIFGTLTTVQKDNLVMEPEVILCDDPMILQKARGNNPGGLHELSPTITSSRFEQNHHLFYLKKRIRRLTPRECFRLQGFPDSFRISEVSDTQAYKQAGNSIPVTVLKEIFRNLIQIIS